MKKQNIKNGFRIKNYGWFALLFYLVMVLIDFFRIDKISHSASDTLRPWITDSFIIGLIFILIYYIWNQKNDKKDNQN